MAKALDFGNLTFGIEIETINASREKIAKELAKLPGFKTPQYLGGHFQIYSIKDGQNREWQVMFDSSIGTMQCAEIVSPILKYEDMPLLQDVIRTIRTKAKAKVNERCGIHIHIGASAFDANSVTRLVKIVNKQEGLIETALDINNLRKSQYCQGVDPQFLYRLERANPNDLDQMNRLWYGHHQRRPMRYHSSRYRGVNLHNIWYRGTIEFRWFNSTLHAGEVKSYVQFVMALCSKAINAKKASSSKRKVNKKSTKYDFRVFLNGLGMIGEEYKTARLHLLKHLEGSIAFKNSKRKETTNG